MNWEEQHERAMRDPRVRGDDGEPVAPEGSKDKDRDIADDTGLTHGSFFPPDVSATNEVGSDPEDKEMLDEELRR